MTSLAHCTIDEAAEALSCTDTPRRSDSAALAAAVEIAHAITLSWHLTLSRKLVRLNVGPLKVLRTRWQRGGDE